ncbi:hypothetical protein Hanom_Chr13g01230651 [Helianthus anomalus]
MRPLYMFFYLTKRRKFFVHVCLFIKRTNTNELLDDQYMNCSPNVLFVCNPN